MLRLATFLGRKIVAPFSRSPGFSDSFNQKLKAKELTGQTIQASIRTILQVQFSPLIRILSKFHGIFGIPSGELT